MQKSCLKSSLPKHVCRQGVDSLWDSQTSRSRKLTSLLLAIKIPAIPFARAFDSRSLFIAQDGFKVSRVFVCLDVFSVVCDETRGLIHAV